jgi:hypothetical protein
MMPRYIEQSADDRTQQAYTQAYYDYLGHMNRKERRTAHGRMLVAEAENKALLAKIAVLEAELEERKL